MTDPNEGEHSTHYFDPTQPSQLDEALHFQIKHGPTVTAALRAMGAAAILAHHTGFDRESLLTAMGSMFDACCQTYGPNEGSAQVTNAVNAHMGKGGVN